MKQTPILMSPDLAQKTAEGLKTVTRRLLNREKLMVRLANAVYSDIPVGPRMVAQLGAHHARMNQHGAVSVETPWKSGRWLGVKPGEFELICPYGGPGDLLVVRESFRIGQWFDEHGRILLLGRFIGGKTPFQTLLTAAESAKFRLWKRKTGGFPGMFMFDSMARSRPPIVSVRAERIAELTEAEAIKEGARRNTGACGGGMSWSAYQQFQASWEKRYPGTWDANAWVWVIHYEKTEAPR